MKPIAAIARFASACALACLADAVAAQDKYPSKPIRMVVPLSPGATSWNEEQSRRNFLMIEQVAQPGNLESPILKHPLDEKAGGD